MEKVYLSWKDVEARIEAKYSPSNGEKFYGVPKGGMIITAIMAKMGFTITFDPSEADLIIDDLLDSGKTHEYYKEKYPDTIFTVLYNKQTEPGCTGKWIVFPWEKDHPAGEESVEDNITRVLEYIGEKPERAGLVDTPKRVVRMYSEIFRGYNPDLRPKVSVFKNGMDGLVYDQMIIDTGNFYSHCEHHMVPFFGQYWFGYVPDPNGNIIGLSKVARIVDYHAAKLQIQERLVKDILDHISEELTADGAPRPLGMGLVMEGEHLCKTMRGVKKKGKMRTTKLIHAFLDNPAIKGEFLNTIKNGL